jgi:DNA replication licensing factor MCM7
VSTQKALAVREANGALMGQLISIKGMVTRVSDVKPSIVIAAYTCSSCGSEVFQEVRLLYLQ